MIRVRVAALIINEKKEILLVNHKKDNKSYWLLPGGGVKNGEKLPETFKREMKEETGLESECGDLVISTETIYPESDRHIIHLIFNGKVDTNTDDFSSEDERVKGAKYVSIDEFKKIKFYPDIKDIILKYLNSEEIGLIYNESSWID